VKTTQDIFIFANLLVFS